MTRTVVQILGHGDIAELARNDRTDGQLLDLFVRQRDEEAFATVVRRHGAMVLGVCRRVLRNAADADDAFQAAFLVLARKAATIGARELLAQWLHGVAYNTARRLRRSLARRARREKPIAGLPEPLAAYGSDTQAELLAVLDEEVNRLSENYRSALILCDLEGATRREAARILGWPEGTVAGRLARARSLLAERLAGRGVVVPGALLIAVLERSSTVTASNPPEFFRAIASGRVADQIAETAERVIQTMFIQKLKPILVAILVWGIAIASIAGAMHMAATAQPVPTRGESQDPKPKSNRNKDDRKFTLIRLRSHDPREISTKLNERFPKSVTIAAVRDEQAIIVYATEAATREVFNALGNLGEDLTAPAPAEPKRYTLSFRTTDWKDVFEWYAKISGLTPLYTYEPVGNLTLTPPRERQFTIGEITDLLNEALIAQKFILIRRDLSFTLHPSDEKIDFSQIPRIELSELSNRGKTELVQVLLPLRKLNVEDTAPELQKLLTPFGVLSILARMNTLVIVDTAGNIKRIVETIRQVEDGGQMDVPPRKPGPVVPSRIAPRDSEGVDPEMFRPDLFREPMRDQTAVIRLKKEIDCKAAAAKVEELFGGRKELASRVKIVAIPVENALQIDSTPLDLLIIKELLRDKILADTPTSGNVGGPKKHAVSFKDTPWADVLDWYAREAGLIPVYTNKPEGKITIQPPKDRLFTIAEVTDLLNDALERQKFVLVRNAASFTLIPTDQIPDYSRVPRIELSELPSRGKTELVQVVLPFKTLKVNEIKLDIEKLLTPLGKAVAIEKANSLIVTERAGNISRILEVCRTTDGESLIVPPERK